MKPRSIAKNINDILKSKAGFHSVTSHSEYYDWGTHSDIEIANESTFLANTDIHLLDRVARLLQGETETIDSPFHQYVDSAPVPVMCWSTLVPNPERTVNPGDETPVFDSLGINSFNGAMLATKPENRLFKDAFIQLLERKEDKDHFALPAASTANRGTSHYVKLSYIKSKDGKSVAIEILDSVSTGIIEGGPEETAREAAEHSTNMSRVLTEMFTAMLADKFPRSISVNYQVSQTPQDAANCGIEAVLNAHDLKATPQDKRDIRKALQTITDSLKEKVKQHKPQEDQPSSLFSDADDSNAEKENCKIAHPLMEVMHRILVNNLKTPSYAHSMIEFIPDDLRPQKSATPEASTPRKLSTADDQALIQIGEEESKEAQRHTKEKKNKTSSPSISKLSSHNPSLTIDTTYHDDITQTTSDSPNDSKMSSTTALSESKIDEQKIIEAYNKVKELTEKYNKYLRIELFDLWMKSDGYNENESELIELLRIYRAAGSVTNDVKAQGRDRLSIRVDGTKDLTTTQIGTKLFAVEGLLQLFPKEKKGQPAPQKSVPEMVDILRQYDTQLARVDDTITQHRSGDLTRFLTNVGIALASLFLGAGVAIAAYRSHVLSGSYRFWQSTGKNISEQLHEKINKSGMKKGG